MKTTPHKGLVLFVFSLLFSGIFSTANAQSKTLFYWSFDHFNSGLAIQGDPKLMKPIYASWASTDTSKGFISDVTVPGTSKYYKAYWDNYPIAEAGDTFNVQHGGLYDQAAGNLAMRLRNPNDSMQLLITAPTTHYKNIAIKFDVFKSGSGPVKDLFDYSTDGGTTWTTTGLSIPSDSPSAATWIPVTVKISNSAAENNPKFIFRLKTTPPNSANNGNDRFDNFSVAGDTATGGTPPPSGQIVMYYWNFDHFVGLPGPGSPSLILPMHSNWSTLDSTKGLLSYVPAYKVSSKYVTYWDVVAGEASDTFNVKKGGKSGTATGNNELRFRNPSDSMEALIAVPTTRYKNITIKYDLERTGSGQGAENFDYSTDGGTTWKTSGLSVKHDSADVIFHLVTVSLAADTTVNHNPNGFIFRIKFTAPNSATNGNNRIDNLSVEGDTDKIKGVTPPPGQKLIHYFHFNNLNTGLTAAVAPSTFVPIHANWSSLDSTKALISYTPAYKVSSKYATWWDAYPTTAADSDNYNAQRGAPAGNALRVRNPSDSMQLEFAFPTTHYKNITLKYGCEKSSLGSGQAKQVFDYSINGGANWRTAGLSIKSDSITNTWFNLITISMANDTAINNNPNFIFRIKFVGQNSGASGNNRFDNVTLQGDTDKATSANEFSGVEVSQPGNDMNCGLYPNPAQNNVTLSTGSENAKTITVTSIEGKMVYTTTSNNMNVQMDISSLRSGIYIVNVLENQTGKSANLRLVRN